MLWRTGFCKAAHAPRVVFCIFGRSCKHRKFRTLKSKLTTNFKPGLVCHVHDDKQNPHSPVDGHCVSSSHLIIINRVIGAKTSNCCRFYPNCYCVLITVWKNKMIWTLPAGNSKGILLLPYLSTMPFQRFVQKFCVPVIHWTALLIEIKNYLKLLSDYRQIKIKSMTPQVSQSKAE